MRILQQKFEQEEIEAMSKLFDQAEEKINGDLENKQTEMLMTQRQSLEGAKAIGEDCVSLASDIKVNLKGQGERLENANNNLFQLQKDVNFSSKLLDLISMQRRRNKYVLWLVYSLMTILCLAVMYKTFGWMLPSLESSDAGTVKTQYWKKGIN